MKTIYIVRHAKSSWNFPELPDEERPLLEKGKKRTRLVIEYLHEKEVVVDLIITSHAVRARETAKIVARSIKVPETNIQISRTLYFGDEHSYFDLLYDLSDDIASIMLVGHNPVMTNFANLFLTKKTDWLPTSAVIAVRFDTDKWPQIPDAGSKVAFYITPKLISNKRRKK